MRNLENELANRTAQLQWLKKRNVVLVNRLRTLVNHLPESEIELAREVWGNTNTGIIIDVRKEAADTLALLDIEEE